MRIVTASQRTPEWLQAKKGIPSASNFDRILTAKTGKPSAQADEYINELIAESLTDMLPERAEFIGTRAMQYGAETEAEACRWFSMQMNADVQQVGFCLSDCGRWGCSPDGLLGDDAGLELKCPLGKTQVRYLQDAVLPAEYKPQVHGALIVTGRSHWYFCSYCIGLPALLVRVEPDQYTDRLRAALVEFSERYQAALAKIRAMAQ